MPSCVCCPPMHDASACYLPAAQVRVRCQPSACTAMQHPALACRTSFTTRWKGSLRMSSSVLFWYLRISRNAFTPVQVAAVQSGVLGQPKPYSSLFARSCTRRLAAGWQFARARLQLYKNLEAQQQHACRLYTGFIFRTAVVTILLICFAGFVQCCTRCWNTSHP